MLTYSSSNKIERTFSRACTDRETAQIAQQMHVYEVQAEESNAWRSLS